jgi:AcrR family transcriptional regulator
MPTNTPRRSLKETLRQKRAELILEIAEAIAVEKGYHDTSMDEIAERAGVSKGTLYQHFSTKDDLFFALIEQTIARFEQLFEQVLASSGSAQSKLERILRAIYVEQDMLHLQFLQLLRRDEDLRKSLNERKEQLRERRARIIKQITDIFEEGKAEGLFESAISTDLMLFTFLNLLTLKGHSWLFVQEQLAPEELIRQISRLFFNGIKRNSEA